MLTPLDLRQYCDLTDRDLAALRHPAGASHSQRVVLSGDGLLDLSTLTLTAAGVALRDRAQRLLRGEEALSPPLALSPEPVGRLSPQLAGLRYVAEHPGVAWRYLTQLFGRDTVAQCHAAGWLAGELRRGAPQALTPAGVQYVTEEKLQ